MTIDMNAALYAGRKIGVDITSEKDALFLRFMEAYEAAKKPSDNLKNYGREIGLPPEIPEVYSSPANTALVQKLVDAGKKLKEHAISMECELDRFRWVSIHVCAMEKALTEAEAWLGQRRCIDEGCPFYGTDARCQPKEGGCVATVAQEGKASEGEREQENLNIQPYWQNINRVDALIKRLKSKYPPDAEDTEEVCALFEYKKLLNQHPLKQQEGKASEGVENALEIYEFAYEKYGEHVVALRNSPQGGGVQLFNTVKLFAENNSLKEYERVKDEAADFAKKFVEQFNAPNQQPAQQGKRAEGENPFLSQDEVHSVEYSRGYLQAVEDLKDVRRYRDFMEAIIAKCIAPHSDFKGGETQRVAQIQVMAETALKPAYTTSQQEGGAS